MYALFHRFLFTATSYSYHQGPSRERESECVRKRGNLAGDAVDGRARVPQLSEGQGEVAAESRATGVGDRVGLFGSLANSAARSRYYLAKGRQAGERNANWRSTGLEAADPGLCAW